jgi:serine/threonine-protein kinase RsbW
MEQHGTEIHSRTYPSLKDSRKRIIEEVISVIARDGTPVNLTTDELYLVIDEALTNAMEHGNRWNPEKNINIRVGKNLRQLFISIRDQGKGFDKSAMNMKEGSIRNIKPRGRGIYIIKHFCSPEWNESGNEITLRFDLNR